MSSKLYERPKKLIATEFLFLDGTKFTCDLQILLSETIGENLNSSAPFLSAKLDEQDIYIAKAGLRIVRELKE